MFWPFLYKLTHSRSTQCTQYTVIQAAKERAADAAKQSSDMAVREAQHRIGKDDNSSVNSGSENKKPRGTSAAARSEMRKDRKSRLKEHLSKKPKEDEDDVRDIEAIQYAEKTVGIYLFI